MGFKRNALKYTSPTGFLAVVAADKLADPKAEQVAGGEPTRKERKTEERRAKVAVRSAALSASGILYQSTGKGGYEDNNRYLVTLTAEKVTVTWKKLGISGKSGIDTIPLRNITSVDVQGGRIYRNLSIQSFGQSIIAHKLESGDAMAAKAAIERAVAKAVDEAQAQASQPQVIQSQESASDKLLKLGQLRDAGVLTEDEYAAKRLVLIDLI